MRNARLRCVAVMLTLTLVHCANDPVRPADTEGTRVGAVSNALAPDTPVWCDEYPQGLATWSPTGPTPMGPLRASPNASPDAGTAVILIRGWEPFLRDCKDFKDPKQFASGEVYFEKLLSILEVAPWRTRARLWVFTYPTFNAFQFSGQKLATILESSNLTNVVLVGHSMGGLVAREAAFHLATSRPNMVLGIVTLATPHLGSDGFPLIDKLSSPGTRSLERGLADRPTPEAPLFTFAGELVKNVNKKGVICVGSTDKRYLGGCVALQEPSDGVVSTVSAFNGRALYADGTAHFPLYDHSEMRNGQTGVATGQDPLFALLASRIEALLPVSPPPFSPTIQLSSTTATFTGVAGGSNPPPQNTLTIANVGTGTLTGLMAGTVTYGPGAAGWLSADVSPATAPTTLALSTTTTGLAVGTYTATVPVETFAVGVTNSPQTVAVTLQVTSAGGVTPTSLPANYDDLGSVVVAGGKLYIVGGFGGLAPDYSKPCFQFSRYLCSNWEFDPLTGQWTSRAIVPEGGGAFHGAPAQSVAGQFYLFGSNDLALTKTVSRYDPVTNSWTRRSDMLSLGIAGVSAVIGSKIYVNYSNMDENTESDPTTYVPQRFDVYDALTDTWARLTPPPTNQAYGVGGVIGGKFYLTGGDYQNAQLDIYDPATDRWTVGAPLPLARDGSAAGVVFGNKLYVIGGFRWVPVYGSLARVDIYDPTTNSWSAGPSLPQARHWAHAVVLSGKICVIGGVSAPGPTGLLNTIVCLDPTAPQPIWQ